ncbi:MAG: hypothetical protein C0600_04570 [Ignavibacteria bacterium]|nr:MAG: hypothetical protein C0600_04570 [Ignavibacteria bacterium]
MDRRSFLNSSVRSSGTGLAMPAKEKPRKGTTGPEIARLHQQALAEREGSLKGLPEPVALPRLVTAGLDPYVPSGETPWDKQRAGYLLRRTLFGATRSDIDTVLTQSPGDVVDQLLQGGTMPTPPGSWVTEDYYYDNTNNDSVNRGRLKDLREWWTGLMVEQGLSIREKMTFFWSDHWATEALTVRSPHYNFWFVDLFRQNFLGNFKQLVKDVTISPAMLIYLDGWYNTKRRPNENYARELMELHTLGEGNGYTEDDIQEAARALTGWTLKKIGTSPVGTSLYDPKASEFIASRYDETEKTFMGRTGTWGYEDVVDIIFAERAQEVSEFICRKLYREFVYEIADETIIGQLATILRDNNWDILPVMRTMLKSEHFFETANIGAHITSPQEFYIGSIRALDIETTNYKYIYQVCSALGCQLLEAPSVKGWDAYRSWISASRLASRLSVGDELVFGNMSSTPKYSVDAIDYVSTLSDPNNARQMIQDILEYIVPLKLSTNQFEILLDKLLAGAPEYEWNINLPGAEGHVKDLLKAILRLSESQLC